MGYYTRYELTTVPECKAALDDLSSVSEEFVYASGQEAKWYEHEEELKKFSKSWPKLLFVLEGHGEEAGDSWRKYFYNGKVEEAVRSGWSEPTINK